MLWFTVFTKLKSLIVKGLYIKYDYWYRCRYVRDEDKGPGPDTSEMPMTPFNPMIPMIRFRWSD